MKFFIDTADVNQIEQALQMGLVDGVTTNPTLISKTGRPFMDTAKEILKLVYPKPVSLEVVSLDYESMVREARILAELSDNVVIKIPMTVDGMRAVKTLSREGIKTNVTLVFSPLQALLAAKAGATYVSPFVGRLDDIGHNGMLLVEQIVDIYKNYDFDTQIIVASVRHPKHVLESAIIGADIVTVPYGVIVQLSKHPLTDVGLKRFLEDWEKVPDKDSIFK